VAQARIGVIGIGTFGINHLRCFRQMGYAGEAQLVAAADVNEELLAERGQEFEFTPYSDYKEMLANEQLDGITVVTPDPYHRAIVIDVANAGVHILCEKPLDVTVAGCQEMIDAAAANDVLLQVDFHKRYDEYHIAMKQKIEAGDLGDIEYGYSHMEDRIEVPRDWRTASRSPATGSPAGPSTARPAGSWGSTSTTSRASSWRLTASARGPPATRASSRAWAWTPGTRSPPRSSSTTARR